MPNSSRPVFIHRTNLFDSFKAILRLQESTRLISNDDKYSEAYMKGFDDALSAISDLIGFTDSLEEDVEQKNLVVTMKNCPDPGGEFLVKINDVEQSQIAQKIYLSSKGFTKKRE